MSDRLCMLLALPFAAVIYCLRPLFPIRIGRIDAARLGFMAFQPDVHFFNQRKHGTRGLSIFYFDGATSNSELQRLWARVLPTFRGARHIAAALALFPQPERFEVHTSIIPTEDYSGYFKSTPPPVRFTPAETARGLEELRRWGIPEDQGFFCFTNRDTSQFQSSSPEALLANSYRNFSIDDLKAAVTTLTGLGLHGVRIGVSSTPLNWDLPQVYDYAHLSRTEFMDLFLLSRCRFFIGPNAGPYVVSKLFRRPVGLVNVAPLTGTNGYFSEHDIIIPKKYRFIGTDRLMSLREIMKSEAHSSLSSEELRMRGIELVSNTAEEIRELAAEMQARLTNSWQALPGESELQNAFQRIIRESLKENDLRLPRVGAMFLLKNPEFF